MSLQFPNDSGTQTLDVEGSHYKYTCLQLLGLSLALIYYIKVGWLPSNEENSFLHADVSHNIMKCRRKKKSKSIVMKAPPPSDIPSPWLNFSWCWCWYVCMFKGSTNTTGCWVPLRRFNAVMLDAECANVCPFSSSGSLTCVLKGPYRHFITVRMYVAWWQRGGSLSLACVKKAFILWLVFLMHLFPNQLLYNIFWSPPFALS